MRRHPFSKSVPARIRRADRRAVRAMKTAFLAS